MTPLRRFVIPTLVALAVSAANKPAYCQGISISNFQLTGTSVRFNINGTFPSPIPGAHVNALFFTNPNISASPGFALGEFENSASNSFSGLQPLRSSPNPIATGGPEYGDYFYVAFENAFSIGDSINGAVTANWSSVAFAPNQVSSLNVFWGASSPESLTNTGTLLTTVAVPEPTTCAMALAGIACGGYSMWRRRSKRA